MGHHNSKTVVPVTILWVVPVTIGATHVVTIVVERAAPQHTTSQPLPAKTEPQGSAIAIGSCSAGLVLPATQQPPQLGDQAAGMFILTGIDPFPLVGKP